jgi:hypothetical protein
MFGRMRSLRQSIAVPVYLAALSLAGAGSLLAGQGPILVSGKGTARLELTAGTRISVPLPRGAALSSVAALGEGWIAAGITPAAEPESAEILLITGKGGKSAALPPPPGRLAPVRQEPMPLVDGDRLEGLVWLEGADRSTFSVRFAAWTGKGWTDAQTISQGGKGSQLALATARLGDGSWLLAWSAFDGTDDEILWSQWDPSSREGWSRPRRAAADNAVPDITPALTTAGDTALLAWSRFDGEGYSTVIARFRGSEFSAPQGVGPAGTLYPSFEAAADGSWLLLRQADPSGWAVVELDGAGKPQREAALATATTARPVVSSPAGPGKSVTFRWPAARQEAQAEWKAARPLRPAPSVDGRRRP